MDTDHMTALLDIPTTPDAWTEYKPCARCGKTSERYLRRGHCHACNEHYRALDGYQSSYVDAGPARRHVKKLRKAGLGLRRISELSKVSRSVLTCLMNGKMRNGRREPPSPRISGKTAEAILAVRIPRVKAEAVGKSVSVDGQGCQLRLKALVALGYTQTQLAFELGWAVGNFNRLIVTDKRVTANTALEVNALYLRLRHRPADPPSTRSLNTAEAKGWLTPDKLDERLGEVDETLSGTKDLFAEVEKQSKLSKLKADGAQPPKVDIDAPVVIPADMAPVVVGAGGIRPSERIASKPATEAELVALLVPYELEPDEDQWQDKAVCASVDSEIFFPEKGGSTREAKKVCLSCPVRAECLEYALRNEERFGIWGGLSERERRRLVKGLG